MFAEDEINLVLLGKVIKPHGIKGEIKIYPYSGQPEIFLGYKEIIFSDNKKYDSLVSFKVEKSRVQGKIVVVKLVEISTRNNAQELVGQNVLIRRDQLPQLNENEFYLCDLLGKTAVTQECGAIGEIISIMNTGAHDVLVIRNHDKEYLIPVCKEFFVNHDQDRVFLKVIPGLLEINNS